MSSITSYLSYDVLGWRSAFLIGGRAMIQATFTRKYGWDQPLESDLAATWNTWAEDIPNLNDPRASVERHLPLTLGYSVHISCDGGKDAYCAIAHLRFSPDNGETWTTRFIAARAKVRSTSETKSSESKI